jgi:hypothetical protein
VDAISLGTQSLAVGLIVKASVDVYRKLPLPSPGWALLLAAFLSSQIGAAAVTYAEAGSLTGPLVARGVIVGFLAFAGAVAATEIHEKAREGERPSQG